MIVLKEKIFTWRTSYIRHQRLLLTSLNITDGQAHTKSVQMSGEWFGVTSVNMFNIAN